MARMSQKMTVTVRGAKDYLDGFVQLHRIKTPEERRALWRQSVATLASAVTEQRPVPLEGYDPEALLAGVKAAFADNLIDDLDWLSPPSAAAALYEIASAIPMGHERRELGRRVLKRLHEGDAATFVALATLLALGSRRALSGAPIRARVALALDLPIGTGARADALALALISRRDLEREWLSVPSTGALPSRRLAARLLERAAREAARRHAQGDDGGLRVFEEPTVQQAWGRLLEDRESLVWRHVATARGLLSKAIPAFGDQIQRDLALDLTPTEWRRASASLAASIALEPWAALARARAVLESEILKRDPGVSGALIYGLPRAAEAEPETAESLLEEIVRGGGIDAFEALVELRRERVGADFGAWACQFARAQIRDRLAKGGFDDVGKQALMEALEVELAPPDERAPATLREQLASALSTFADKSARDAYRQAHEVLTAAEATMTLLEVTKHDGDGMRHGFRALRELDIGIFETSALADLLVLGTRTGESETVVSPLGELYERLTAWLIQHEREPIPEGKTVPHPTHRLRRLRTMLRLVDADGSFADSSGALRERRLRMARVLLTRVQADGDGPLKRTVSAAFARACDALVREELGEVSDVLIAAASHVRSQRDLMTFAEASMVPEIESAIRAYSSLTKIVAEAPRNGRGARACLDALFKLARDLPNASSPRVEALRAELLRFGRALEAIAASGSLRELEGSGEWTPLLRLEAAAQSVAQLVAGARRRLAENARYELIPTSGPAVRLLDFAVERALRNGESDELGDALLACNATLRDELPAAIADVAVRVLERVPKLPAEGERRARTSFVPVPQKEPPLPPWLPPGRTLGGFYVLRGLGAGAVGSVFVVKRLEERTDPNALRFALKVPDYDGAAARTLSEAQFLELFREEAGALLALPQHPNLARFVTFDAGARPKPILVMELVEGPTLERVVELADLEVERGLALLDGVAAGLAAMHSVGIGHLDLKPGNVILREGDGNGRKDAPVLVDFGLAGRQVRPGCATGNYGAPEIWGLVPKGVVAQPTAADVYAFGCVAYEVLTGRTLFDDENEMALIHAHLDHDGRPPGVIGLWKHTRLTGLAKLIESAIRKDPRQRASIGELRAGLKAIRADLEGLPWPLPAN